MKTKGLVMEIEKNAVIVMTPCGRFRRLPKRGHVDIGDEYSYASAGYRSWLAVASVFLLLVSSVFATSVQGVPAAYVSVDINPSLELAVSRSGKVLTAEALNREASVILQDMTVEGLRLERAIAEIYQSAENYRFVDSEDAIVLLAAVPAGNATRLPSSVSHVMASFSTAKPPENGPVYVAAVFSDSRIREQAKVSGLSTGKYAVYVEARNAGYPVQLASLQQEGIMESLFEDAAPVQYLRNVRQKKDLAVLSQLLRVTVAQLDDKTNKLMTVNQEDIENTETATATPGGEEPVVKPEPAIAQKPKPPKPKKPQVAAPPESSVPPVSGKPDSVTPPEAPQEEPKEEPVIEPPLILPAENEPVLEEARRSIFDWFRDILAQ